MFFFSRGEQVALALLVMALMAAGGAAWWVASHGGPPPEPFFVDAPASPAADKKVTVHIAGQVEQPGVYTVPAGTRVADAIAQAGGATAQADLDRLNLAAEVTDGQQVYVPAAAAAPEAGSADAKPAPLPRGKISINRAGVEELTALPGIGPVYARRIVEYRERLRAETGHGFTRIEQLLEVPGIGPKRFADLQEHVTL